MSERRLHIAVVGAGVCPEPAQQVAEAVGREIAHHQAVLVCGGLGGVMESAARGARTAGGLVVGILPSYDASTANPWVDVVIVTGLGHARNVLVVASGDAVIALPGEHGTASEINLALKLGRPVVALGAWEAYDDVVHADTPEQAVSLAVAACGR
jgi:hypothetical protein